MLPSVVMPEYRFVVDPNISERLDRYLVRRLPDTLSRVAVQRTIRHGEVTVDGHPAKPNRQIRSGQTIVIRFPEPGEATGDADLQPEDIPLDVVYEDDQLLVVNKPPGLVTHPAPGHWTGTLVNAILGHYARARAAAGAGQGEERKSGAADGRDSGPLPRAGIVHRLDKDTSGLLLVAKTEESLRLLARQLKARTMGRRYAALVEGHVPFDEGTIDASIGRHAKDRKLMAVRLLGGRQAVTHYRVLRRFSLAGLQGTGRPASLPCALLVATLETGRTHQVRVHCAHLGHPIVGDATYGRHPKVWQALGIQRQMLHAFEMRFVHPVKHTPCTVRAPLPEDMRRWVGDVTLPGEGA